MTSKHWTFVGERPHSDHRIFRVRHDLYRLEGGAERAFVVLDGPDWVNVVPITADERVVLVRQYRHGVRCDTLEIPGGMVDAGEHAADAARRELREETGFDAERFVPLGEVWPNPAFQVNACATYLAEGALRVGEPHPDPYERIEVVTEPLSAIPRLIKDGVIKHSLVVTAFALLGILAPPLFSRGPREGAGSP